MALLYCFPEIHLRQSMHYCPSGVCRSAGCGLESGNIGKLTVTALGINISSKWLDLNNIIENSKRIRIFAFLSVARVAKW